MTSVSKSGVTFTTPMRIAGAVMKGNSGLAVGEILLAKKKGPVKSTMRNVYRPLSSA